MTTFLFSVLNHRKSFKLCNGHLIKRWFALGWLIQDKGTLPGKRTHTHTREVWDRWDISKTGFTLRDNGNNA